MTVATAQAAGLRILVITSYLPGVGGGELQTALQVETLARRGHRVTVLDIGSNPEAPAREVIRGIPVMRVRAPRWPILEGVVAQAGFFLLLRRLLPGHDLIQFNHLGPELLATRWLAARFEVPLTLVVWGSSRAGIGPFGPGWRHALARRAARKIRHVVALGSETRLNLLARGFREAQLEVISNGVDMERFRPGAGNPPADLPVNGPVVVSVGRMVPAKGYDVLLDAWQDIVERSPQGTLVLLGDGPLRRDLEQEVARRGLTGRVVFTGLRRDIPVWLAHAHAYVSSSLTEGMSNALLEAIASGLPVVATRVGGAEDVVTQGENGFLVAPGSARELSQALEQLLDDEGLRRTMGARARERAEQEFAIDVIVDRYEKLFRRAVAAGGCDRDPVHGEAGP